MTDNLFIEAARTGRNEPWRYMITVLLAILLIFGSTACLTIAAFVMTGGVNIQAVLNLPPALFLIVNLLPFAFIIAALWFGMVVLHRRRFFSLIEPRTWSFDWKRFFLSAGLWLVISAAGDAVLSLVQPGNYVFHFDPLQLLPYLVAALILIPIQSSAEEMLFRGYLTQALGLAGGFWVALLAPAVLFGLLHGANPEVGAFGMLWTLPVYISLGLLLGWVTLRSESLEMALGLHITNNLYSSLLVTYPSSAIKSPALIAIQNYNPPLSMAVGLVGMLLYLLLLNQVGRGFFRKGLFRLE